MEPRRPEEIGGLLGKVNRLGTATERLFSRLYLSLSQRSRYEQRVALEARIEAARRTEDQNQQLRQQLTRRTVEVEQLSGMLAALDDGIIMQDNEGRIAYMNDAARTLLGSQKNLWESDLGMLFDNFQHVTQVESELTPLGEPKRIQVNDRILGAQLAAVANVTGERLGTMIILRDITRTALADRIKDQFATAISHELKTPMTVIKGMSEVLLNAPEDQPANRRLLETLSRNVDILNRMVVELLDVSEMGAGAFEIRDDEIDLVRLLWDVINGLEPDIKRQKLEICFMARATLPVTGDAQRLHWALGHVIQNSVHYTESDGQITVLAGLNDQGSAAITVEDNGVGITDKDLPHIFERFYRGDPRDASGKLVDPRGLGQGLFIARTVAEAHGGYVGVESIVGKGSTFTVVVPSLKQPALPQ
jgi:signal transduction histidine kinase